MTSPALVWFRSHRDPDHVYRRFTEPRMTRFAEIAASVDLDFVLTDVDGVEFTTGRGDVRVRVAGETVDPERTLFHTVVATPPAYYPDAARHLSVFAALEQAGFLTTAPALSNLVNSDKLLTLVAPALRGVHTLPTLRIATRQFGFTPAGLLDRAGLAFPLAVKPANWGSGMAISRVTDARALDTVLQLAGAGELTMVLQPWIDGLVDYRIYCIDGAAYTAVLREPQGSALVSNVGQGGRASFVDPPAEMRASAEAFAARLGVQYLCVDFVTDGEQVWLSEIELDGGLPPLEGSDDIIRARFSAYRRRIDEPTRRG